MAVDISKMRANFKSVWVRKLIGKLGVPYNRRLRVRGSPHPLFYDADLSLPAADSNAFRIQSPREVFDLHGHPKAKRAYGWSHLDGKNDEEERFVTVLEIPPVESALTAVRVSIVADGKKRRNQEKN